MWRQSHFVVKNWDTSFKKKIRTLKNENRALKNENEALKNKSKDFKTAFWILKIKKTKKYDCLLCKRSYNRLNKYYQHLQEKNSEHQNLAQELYKNTRCKMYNKNFKT